MTRRGMFRSIAAACIAPFVPKLAARVAAPLKPGDIFTMSSINAVNPPNLGIRYITRYCPHSNRMINRMEYLALAPRLKVGDTITLIHPQRFTATDNVSPVVSDVAPDKGDTCPTW